MSAREYIKELRDMLFVKKDNALLNAAVAHYEAQRAEALAVLDVYFNNPVGIGEHSNLLDEVKKWVDVLSEAEDNLKTLRTHFLTEKK